MHIGAKPGVLGGARRVAMDGIHTYVTGVARGGAQPAHWAARQDDRASAASLLLAERVK